MSQLTPEYRPIATAPSCVVMESYEQLTMFAFVCGNCRARSSASDTGVRAPSILSGYPPPTLFGMNEISADKTAIRRDAKQNCHADRNLFNQ